MRPDIITFAKGIGNGLALGGVVARAEVMDCIAANSISTFGGNHLTAAGALANLRFILDNDLQSNAQRQGERLMQLLRAACNDGQGIGEVRGKGLMIGIELVEPGTKKPAPQAATRVLEEARHRGLLIGKGGLYGNVLRIAPPLTVTEEEVDEAAGILTDVLRAGS